MAEYKQDFDTLKHGLADYSFEAVAQAVRVLEADEVDRSEKTLGVAKWLLDLHKKLESLTGFPLGQEQAAKNRSRRKDNIIWLAVATAPPGFCRCVRRLRKLASQCNSKPAGGAFDSPRKEQPDCDECGQAFVTNDDGTTNHVGEDGEIDYDRDREHVPFAEDAQLSQPRFTWSKTLYKARKSAQEYSQATPVDWATERWRKMRENSKRANAMTGVNPFNPEGWEKVCVLLMDALDSRTAAGKQLADACRAVAEYAGSGDTVFGQMLTTMRAELAAWDTLRNKK